MENYICALLSVALCAALIGLMAAFTISNYKKQIAVTYQAACIAVFIWSFFTFFLYILPDRELGFRVQTFKYIGVGFNAAALYLHTRYQTTNRPIPKIGMAILVAPAVITAFATITDPWLHLMVRQMYFLRPSPSRVFRVAEYGMWFYAHLIYSYTLIIIAFITLLKLFFSTPAKLRKPVIWMLAAMMMIACSNVVVVFRIVNSPFDFTLPVVVLTLFIFYGTSKVTKSANLLMASREHIYHSISSIIFVLDTDGVIIDCNQPAQALCGKIGVQSFGIPYLAFTDAWVAKYHGTISPYESSIITIIEEGTEYHYRIIRNSVSDYGQDIGSLIMIQEITQIYMLFRYLEESALYDQLTGLFNRNAYMKALEEYKRPENLPIGIIIGDVNHLKMVNDTYGHLVGDDLLKAVSTVLAEAAPSRSVVARIGGDEFAIIIPNASEAECNEAMEKVNQSCVQINDAQYGTPGIALGMAMITHMEQDSKQVIKEADERMYQDKNDRRRR